MEKQQEQLQQEQESKVLKAFKDSCPHCGSNPDAFSETLSQSITQSFQAISQSLAAQANPPKEEKPNEIGMSKWEQDTFRDVINNVNNTLRFQIQLGVPLLAGCITALNVVPPQEHQALLNEIDRFVFLPVLASMGVSYIGLEWHWGFTKDGSQPTSKASDLALLVKRKYMMVHLAILLQAAGLVLLMVFVLLEFK
ncbi:MAG: hypothetical protein K2X77_12920 [Candidatus Obscuribacterales bacterium]|nr:hypothetical protein [Candidatus Obscuribacterales bacterium]